MFVVVHGVASRSNSWRIEALAESSSRVSSVCRFARDRRAGGRRRPRALGHFVEYALTGSGVNRTHLGCTRRFLSCSVSMRPSSLRRVRSCVTLPFETSRILRDFAEREARRGGSSAATKIEAAMVLSKSAHERIHFALDHQTAGADEPSERGTGLRRPSIRFRRR